MPYGDTNPVVDGEQATSIDLWIEPDGDLNLSVDNRSAGPILQTVPGRVAESEPLVSSRCARRGPTLWQSTTTQCKSLVDGATVISRPVTFANGDPWFRRIVVHTGWWTAAADMPVGVTSVVVGRLDD